LLPDLHAARRFFDLYQLVPSLYVGLVRHTARGWGLVAHLVRGEQSYAGFLSRLGPLGAGFELLSDLLRVTPGLQRLAAMPDPPAPERFLLASRAVGQSGSRAALGGGRPLMPSRYRRVSRK
jgi:hypothetical protein